MHVLDTCKNEEDPIKMKALECSQDFSHYKSMGIFPGAQGQLTPQSLVRSGLLWVAIKAMIPYFFAAGHFNYARYGIYYLSSMEAMPNLCRDKFMKGEHVMHHIPGLWMIGAYFG